MLKASVIFFNVFILALLLVNGPQALHINSYCLKFISDINLSPTNKNRFIISFILFFFFFSIWVFFNEHSRITGQQGKGEGILLTPLYHFHPLYRHLDISRVITAESSPLHIAGSRTRTGNLWFPSASR